MQPDTDNITAARPEPFKLAPILYWFAGADTIPPAWRARFGPPAGIWGRLRGLLRGDGDVTRAGQRGPADGVGLMAAPGRADAYAPKALSYEPEAQAWTQVESGVWLGVAHAAKPADFVRSRITLPLAYILSTDRGDWWIPVALLTAEHCNIPCVDAFELGAWRRVPAPGYERLAVAAERLYRIEIGDAADDDDPGPAWLRDTAILAFQANYALTGPELAALGVLNDDTYNAVAAILTDRDARAKKNAESAGSDTSSGAADSSPDTPPHSTTPRP